MTIVVAKLPKSVRGRTPALDLTKEVHLQGVGMNANRAARLVSTWTPTTYPKIGSVSWNIWNTRGMCYIQRFESHRPLVVDSVPSFAKLSGSIYVVARKH